MLTLNTVYSSVPLSSSPKAPIDDQVPSPANVRLLSSKLRAMAGASHIVADTERSQMLDRDASPSRPLDDGELDPTAIVIKNIPFAVKKEQLVQRMVDLNLPLPSTLDYHFQNGVFRGLAFAHFTSPKETEQVVKKLNHVEVSGRKLRVDYKKMVPLEERERIEREKRERRGQLKGHISSPWARDTNDRGRSLYDSNSGPRAVSRAYSRVSSRNSAMRGDDHFETDYQKPRPRKGSATSASSYHIERETHHFPTLPKQKTAANEYHCELCNSDIEIHRKRDWQYVAGPFPLQCDSKL